MKTDPFHVAFWTVFNKWQEHRRKKEQEQWEKEALEEYERSQKNKSEKHPQS